MPYGTDSRLNGFQAINCLATIIQSLRDRGYLGAQAQLPGFAVLLASAHCELHLHNPPV